MADTKRQSSERDIVSRLQRTFKLQGDTPETAEEYFCMIEDANLPLGINFVESVQVWYYPEPVVATILDGGLKLPLLAQLKAAPDMWWLVTDALKPQLPTALWLCRGIEEGEPWAAFVKRLAPLRGTTLMSRRDDGQAFMAINLHTLLRGMPRVV